LAAEERYIAVIHAFLDESGTHAGASLLGVAGFYGSGNQWRTFRKFWKPFARGFHAKDSSTKFPHLCRAIEVSKVNGILITIDKGGYKENANDHVRTVMGNAYAAGTLLCATVICDNLQPKRVSFSIEDGQPNTDFIRRVLEGLKKEKHLAIAAVATVEKSDFIELHTADFVSHIASTFDNAWLQRLINLRQLSHQHLFGSGVADASPKVTRMFQRRRAMRKAARRTQGPDTA
jgi:hypothetical protein